jgi:hypothetical protein
MSHRATKRAAKEGSRTKTVPLTDKELPPERAPMNRRHRKAAMAQVWVWRIVVGGGYGHLYWVGTEEQAEAQRAHKANWERAVARKERTRGVTPEELSYWNRWGPHGLKEGHAKPATKKEKVDADSSQ